ncbi:MAG: YIP1 family protein [Ignavibacteria bacterium]|nr:YIP1 family protein [Ignavibacteria bacterium]
MDEQIQSESLSNESSYQVEKMTFTDKIAGIILEPSRVFENIKIYGPKTIDWLVPILLLIVLTILSNLLITSNPDIKAELEAIQRKATEEALEKEVKAGRITQAQKEERLEQIEKFTTSPVMKIFQYISIAVFIFVFLFILAVIYYSVWVFILKGQGSYSHALSVYGLASFISMIEVIFVSILSLVMVKMVTGFSLAAFLELEKGTWISYLATKINPFTFWWLYVIGVGLGTVYSVPKTKSLIAIFGLWLIYVVIGKFIPFLSFGT